MDIIQEAVKGIEKMSTDCGISDSPINIVPDPSIVPCAYEKGAVMKVIFGGRTAEITSADEIRTTTKASFMFGAMLKKPLQRAAAAGIINAISGFLCTTRKLHSCLPNDHKSCLTALSGELEGKNIYCYGTIASVRSAFADKLVDSPEKADIILVTGEGLISTENAAFPDQYADRILYLGPSTVGTSAIMNGCHFCPFGRTNL